MAMTYSLQETVREGIQRVMDERGVGSTELARRLGISRQAVWYLLQGRSQLTLQRIEQIAKALNVPVEKVVRPL